MHSFTLSEIDRACNTIDEDTPNAIARAQAVNLIGISLPPATYAESFESDILVHWDNEIKTVILVCYGSGEHPQIYTQFLDLSGKVAVHSEFVEATPLTLAEVLA